MHYNIATIPVREILCLSFEEETDNSNFIKKVYVVK